MSYKHLADFLNKLYFTPIFAVFSTAVSTAVVIIGIVLFGVHQYYDKKYHATLLQFTKQKSSLTKIS